MAQAMAGQVSSVNTRLLRYASRKTGRTGYHYFRYTKGGANGGNCWGDSAHSYSNDSNERFDSIDDSLEYFLTHEKNFGFDVEGYKKLLRESVESYDEAFDYTDAEYYGNYTDYAVGGIEINKLVALFEDETLAQIFITEYNNQEIQANKLFRIEELNEQSHDLQEKRQSRQQFLDRHADNMKAEDKKLMEEKSKLEKRLAEIENHFQNQDKEHAKNRKKNEKELAGLDAQLEANQAEVERLGGTFKPTKRNRYY